LPELATKCKKKKVLGGRGQRGGGRGQGGRAGRAKKGASDFGVEQQQVGRPAHPGARPSALSSNARNTQISFQGSVEWGLAMNPVEFFMRPSRNYGGGAPAAGWGGGSGGARNRFHQGRDGGAWGRDKVPWAGPFEGGEGPMAVEAPRHGRIGFFRAKQEIGKKRSGARRTG